MIILDTNVLSALMRRDIEAAVISWLNCQPAESIWTTAITGFEVRFGIEILAKGRQRKALENAFHKVIDEDFDGRFCPSIKRQPRLRP